MKEKFNKEIHIMEKINRNLGNEKLHRPNKNMVVSTTD
jgi:hypothetical protein